MTAANDLLRVARRADSGAFSSETDGDLLRRYADTRDETAFAELVRRNGPGVLHACRSILGEVTAAEDVFQAVFLDLARKAGQLARAGSAAGWLHAAAVRAARAARRADVRRKRREQAARAATAADPDDLNWREVREVLDAELAALPEPYRVPLLLCYLHGLTYAEAARRIGCPVGALRGRLERGKDRLRIRLARYGLPLGPAVLVLGRPPTVSAELVRATAEVVRVGMSGGPIPAVIAGLIGLRGWFRTAWVVPALTLGVILAAVLPSAAPRTATSPTPRADPAVAPTLRTDLFGDPLPDGALARLGTTRCRADVRAFGIERDGIVVTIAGGREGVIQTWGPWDDRPRTTTPVTLAGPPGRTFPCEDISPDGRYVVGSTPTRIVVQERRKDGLTEVAAFDIGPHGRLSFSPDGTRLAVAILGKEERKVFVCDIPARNAAVLEGPCQSWESLAFSGDGTKLAAVDGPAVFLWDVLTGMKLARHDTGRVRYLAVALDRTGEVMAVVPASRPDAVIFVDPKTGKRVDGLSGPPAEGTGWVRYAPDGRTVLVGGRTGVRWWDPVTGKLIRTFPGSIPYLSSARISPDGKILVSHTDKMLLRWDAATGKPLFPAAHDGGHQEAVYGVGVSSDGRTVATAGIDHRVRTWEATTGKPLQSFSAIPGSSGELIFSPDGRFLYAPWIGGGGEPMKWDATTGEQVLPYTIDPTERKPTWLQTSLQVSADGVTLTALCRPDNFRDPCILTTWDTATGERLRTTRLDTRSLFGGSTGAYLSPVALSPDRRWVANREAVLPVGAGQEANRLKGGNWVPAPGSPATFSADSRLVAVIRDAQGRPAISGSPPKIPVVYEVATGAPVLELPPEVGSGIAFHPDGRALAAAGPAGLSFWDLAAGKEYTHRPTTLAVGGPIRYFPEGSKLVTVAGDTTALIWEAPARPKGPKPLTASARAAAWEALASPDGAKGWAAVWALADDPEGVAFLRDRVRPAEPLPAAEFRQLLANLGADAFETRERAAKQLAAAGERAVGQLREAIEAELSAEQRRSVELLLRGRAGKDRMPPTGERLRTLRAVAALELAGTSEARKFIAILAGGPADTTVTREAKLAVERARR